MYVTQEFENVTCSAKKGSVILKKKIKELFPFPEIFHRNKNQNYTKSYSEIPNSKRNTDILMHHNGTKTFLKSH